MYGINFRDLFFVGAIFGALALVVIGLVAWGLYEAATYFFDFSISLR